MRLRTIGFALTATGVLLVGSGLTASAQFEKLMKTTPAERADVQTEYMTPKLGLTPHQAAKVGAINLKYATQMEPVIHGPEGPFCSPRHF